MINWKNTSSPEKCGFKKDRFDEGDNPFHAVYLIDNITGSVLLSNKYTNFSSTNEDLISGFLSAMNMFVQELRNDKTEEIQEINFQGSRILYERKGRLMCIGFSKKSNLEIERAILKEIMQDFYFRFEPLIKNFNGFISPEIIQYKNKLQDLKFNSRQVKI